jgi:hydroxyethylthiazole kinase-like uncharacterized protein yjeF
MEPLPLQAYTAAQVRAMDQATIDGGVAGYTLMCRAAAAALQAVKRHWPDRRHLLILAGAGNNGGDGYVMARIAAAEGFSVRLLALVGVDSLQGDAAVAAADFMASGGVAEVWSPQAAQIDDATVIVDALLGTGLDRDVGGEFLAALEFALGTDCPVIALDIPSGLHADTGQPMGAALPADVTVTFVALKQGLFLGAAADYCGALEFAGIGVPAAVYTQYDAVLTRLEIDELAAALPARARSSHKGSHGSLLLVGGGPGMPGAIRLAAEAALRVGAGLVRVATHPDNVAAVTAGRPEVI